VVGILLLYVFAVQLGWFPIGGYGTFAHPAITRATIRSDGLKIAASAIASSSAGNAIIRSVKRMIAAPVQPPR